MKPVKTLVLLANDATARLFENLGPGRGLSEIEDFKARLTQGAEVRYSDRPGRNAAAPGMAHHATADQAEAEEAQSRNAFVRAVVAETEDRFRENGFTRFVMAAAPATLGALRAQLPERLRQALVLDVDKDFTAQSPADVVKRLEGAIVL
ncbi:MAG: host attachment protein [Maritimibacter sp.]|nr:host attachment protein [Maritimibacter sp.]